MSIGRVVMINDHASVNGGQAKVAIESAIYLADAGFRVTFVSGTAPVDQRLNRANLDVVCVGEHDILTHPNRSRAALEGIWNFNAAQAISRLLGKFSASDSIVHLHGWAKALSPSIGSAIVSARIPFIVSLHEFFLACPNGGFYDYRRKAICTRAPLGVSCLTTNCDSRGATHKAWRVGRQLVLRGAGALPAKVNDFIYLSATQLNAIKKYLPDSSRFHYLPNSVSRLAHGRVEVEANEKFLFLGRLSAEKGGVIAALAAKAAGSRIVFAGDGECREEIAAANPMAEMLGWVPQEVIATLLSQARCVVFPSLWYEGYPMVVAEAMERGVPVLAADTSAGAEIVEHDVTGLHVRTGDLDAWIAAFRKISDRNTAAKLSIKSYEAADSLLSRDRYLESLVAIYSTASRCQREQA